MNTAISALMQRAIEEHVFPGGVVGILQNGKKTITPFGSLTYRPDAPHVTNATLYDMASVTKPIPTACVVLKLVEDGVLSLDVPVAPHIPELIMPGCEKITLRHLLTYTVVFELPNGSSLAKEGVGAFQRALFGARLQAEPGSTQLYNNPSAFLFGLVAERATGKKLDQLARELFFAPLNMRATTFLPAPDAEVAPTEIDWRGEIKGDVHDETAWALRKEGIISGHAGLFSTAQDMLTFAEMLLAGGTLHGTQYLRPDTINQMHTNQLTALDEKMGLGWFIPGGQFDFFSSAMSPQSFGMTGFTGTSVQIDMTQRSACIILTNRTYPKRADNKDIINTFRKQIGDIVFG